VELKRNKISWDRKSGTRRKKGQTMTIEQWVDATSKGASFPDGTRPSIQVPAYQTLSGDVEEEETQKPNTKNTRVHLSFSSPPPRSAMKKPLGQSSLTK
jgi:hypothetical protein